MKKLQEKQYHLVGWFLFVLCSIVYSISSVLAKDPIGLLGGLLFFSGCLAFIIPLLRKL